jgi:hypothetical protein
MLLALKKLNNPLPSPPPKGREFGKLMFKLLRFLKRKNLFRLPPLLGRGERGEELTNFQILFV